MQGAVCRPEQLTRKLACLSGVWIPLEELQPVCSSSSRSTRSISHFTQCLSFAPFEHKRRGEETTMMIRLTLWANPGLRLSRWSEVGRSCTIHRVHRCHPGAAADDEQWGRGTQLVLTGPDHNIIPRGPSQQTGPEALLQLLGIQVPPYEHQLVRSRLALTPRSVRRSLEDVVNTLDDRPFIILGGKKNKN